MNTTDLLAIQASYVPPSVLRYLVQSAGQTGEARSERVWAATLFADISGFTALTEELVQRGPGGLEQISGLLNTYFSQIIEQVAQAGGEVIKFAGDALLAFWPAADDGPGLRAAAYQAAGCALAVQHSLRDFRLEALAETRLTLRLSLGAGEVVQFQVGGQHGRWEFVVAGAPLAQAGLALKDIQPGEVALTAAAAALLGNLARTQPLAQGSARLLEILPGTLEAPARLPETALTLEVAPLLRAYLPAAIRARLDAGQFSWLAELRRVTVLFVNLPDFNHTLPLPQAQETMQALQAAIYRYEGSINKLSVDEKGVTLVAALGLPPLAHEDDAVRGVRAALSVQAVLNARQARFAVGVTTGLTFCGVIGNARRREYTLIGALPNLAARLMSAAPGGILCDTATYQAASGLVAFEALPEIAVKGRSERVAVYRPLSELSGSLRSSRLTGTLVGRAEERQKLQQALHNLTQAGQAGVLILEGEAGIGKTRLLEDALHFAAQQPGVCVLYGAADAVEKNTLYHVWRAIFEQIQVSDQLERLAARIPGAPERLALLNEVLGASFPENELTRQMSGSLRADNLNQLMLGLVREYAAGRPVFLALEDAHWLDSSSWLLTLQAVEALKPLLLLLSTRPLNDPLPLEYTRLVNLPQAAVLELRPLASGDALQLVCQRLGVRSLPEPVAALIEDKAEGHPFFSEELAYALRDARLLEIADGECRLATGVDLSNFTFPDTIQGVITSRIDRLPPQQQLTIKVASVIGRVFAYRLLNDVYPLDVDRPHLAHYLQTLERMDLTPLDTPEPELSYIFKHAITQEVAYNLMLFAQRQQLHQAVAEWYEQAHAGDPAPFYAVLAHHWSGAQKLDRALEYLEKAGEQALRGGAYLEAIAFLSQALQISRVAAPGVRRGVIRWGINPPSGISKTEALRHARWYRQLGEAYYGLGRLSEGKQQLQHSLAMLGCVVPEGMGPIVLSILLQAARQAAHRQKRRADAGRGLAAESEYEYYLESARAYALLGEITYFTAETYLGLAAAVASLNQSEKLPPTPEQAKNYANFAIAANLLAAHGLARSYMQRALNTAEQINQIASLAHVLHLNGVYAIGVADWPSAERFLLRAGESAERLSDKRQAVNSLTTRAVLAHYRGQYRASLAFNQAGYEIALHSGNQVQQGWGLYSQAENYNHIGQPDLAVARARQAVPLLAGDTRPLARVRIYHALALGHWRLGQPEQAWQALQEALELALSKPPTAYSGLEAYTAPAEICLELLLGGAALPAPAPTLRQKAARAVKMAQRFARLYPAGRARSLIWLGAWQQVQGQVEAARKSWQQALAQAQQDGMPYEDGLAQYWLGRSWPPGSAQRMERYAQAAAIFEHLGAAYDLQRCLSEGG